MGASTRELAGRTGVPARAPRPAWSFDRVRKGGREGRLRGSRPVASAVSPAALLAGGQTVLAPLGALPTTLAWAPNLSDESLAAQFFAFSLFPYLAFLYYTLRTEKMPRLAKVGFCTLLVFVFATIPAGIYAKKVYGTSLANVDWLHGSAESLLSLTNLLIVLGFREGIRSRAAAEVSGEKRKGRGGR